MASVQVIPYRYIRPYQIPAIKFRFGIIGKYGPKHQQETHFSGSKFLICSAQPLLSAAERIAIEVDGPHHFTANTCQPLGEMLARHKLLKARGWAVISVPFYSWSNKSTDLRIKYLSQVLFSSSTSADGNRRLWKSASQYNQGIKS